MSLLQQSHAKTWQQAPPSTAPWRPFKDLIEAREGDTAQDQTQQGLPSSLRYDDCRLSQCPTHSSSGDEMSTSDISAEYREWPMHGFLKRITMGNEIRYRIEFSLGQSQELGVLASPLHTSWADSDSVKRRSRGVISLMLQLLY
jgi:hypothetical protein